ncbi:MAG: hypothetical protein Kow00103_05630 [Candidatus Caldatribacteriota bacterium]
MSLFYRLLLAHIIADFPLQTKQIFHIKMNTEWGVFLHTLIVLIFSVFLTFPYLEEFSYILILMIILITHTIIDKIKLEYSKKNNDQPIGVFLFDQILHLGIIFILSITFNRSYFLNYRFKSAFLNYLIEIYNNDLFINNLTGYITSIFFIPILLLHIKEKEDITDESIALSAQKKLKIKIPENQTIDKFYRLLLTLSAQYLDDKYIAIIFIGFIIANFIYYQIGAERIEKVYNLKRIINTSLAIFIGLVLKML